MNERIKELAQMSGLAATSNGTLYLLPIGVIHIEHFAELVRQDEREACAKACEKVHDDYFNDRNNDGYDWPDGHDCADAIRARGNT
jgi:hypothetical protein